MAAQLENLGPLAQLRLDRLPLRLLVLLVGLSAYGVSVALMIRAGLGVNPWGVLQVAVAQLTGVSVGTVIIAVSFLMLASWWPLRQVPGIGTLANCVWVGLACDAALTVLPQVETLPAQVSMMLVALALNGGSGAVYLGAQLGPGPRDGLMTGLHRLTGQPLGYVRLGIEGVVLAAGWLLGGPVGVGTVIYAVGVGAIVQWCLPRVLMTVRPGKVATAAG